MYVPRYLQYDLTKDFRRSKLKQLLYSLNSTNVKQGPKKEFETKFFISGLDWRAVEHSILLVIKKAPVKGQPMEAKVHCLTYMTFCGQ